MRKWFFKFLKGLRAFFCYSSDGVDTFKKLEFKTKPISGD